MKQKGKYWVLIPAAGIGRRMGGETPKQYLSIAGLSILEWTLKKIAQLKNIEGVTLILHPKDQFWQANMSGELKTLVTVDGGNERFNSVMNGLKSLKPEISDDDWVLVHDVVRPCVSVSDINKLISSLENDSVGGLLASSVKDTLKLSVSESALNNGPEDNYIVSKTLQRERYWLAATPQMFRYGLLFDALEKALENNLDITDEASAMEAMGHEVKLIQGRSDNIKVTEQSDLGLVEFLLQQEAAQDAI